LISLDDYYTQEIKMFIYRSYQLITEMTIEGSVHCTPMCELYIINYGKLIKNMAIIMQTAVCGNFF